MDSHPHFTRYHTDIPVVQFSLDRTKDASFHYELGKELHSLRYKGILVVGSGNMVHNLGMMAWQDKGYDWALEFDETLRQIILLGDHDSLVHYERLGKAARLSIPTHEHYLPLLYAIALQDKQDSYRSDNMYKCDVKLRRLNKNFLLSAIAAMTAPGKSHMAFHVVSGYDEI
ncbi:MAG: class III extradiol ring-cleavage dioxygenase [Deltaproteobacteria bacterium]|nr:class III extradiol ring-cleavage dioxygenase [Deltaproteobacteria bacterium]